MANLNRTDISTTSRLAAICTDMSGSGVIARVGSPAFTGTPTSTPTGGTAGALPLCSLFSFTEAGSTTYTATCELPAASIIHEIGFVTTVLWDDTGAVTLNVGDDDDADGWFAAVNLKATDLVVGEVLQAMDDGAWGSKDGAYLTTAGRRGQAAAAYSGPFVNSAASEVIFVVTTGNQDGSAGRSFGWVLYTPAATAIAATGA